MDHKAIGILLVIGATILFFHSVRERRQKQVSFVGGFLLGGVSVVLLVLGLTLLSS